MFNVDELQLSALGGYEIREIGVSPTKLKDLENQIKYKFKNKVKYKIESGVGTRDHKILSMLGICQSILTELRYKGVKWVRDQFLD